MNTLLEGIGYGLVLAILTGPIFFSILQISIERGKRGGTALAAGQWFSDFVYIVLVWWGAEHVRDLLADADRKTAFIQYMAGIGGVFLVGMGISMLISGYRAKLSTAQALPIRDKNSIWDVFIQGFLINTLNPTPLFFWATLMSVGLMRNASNLELVGLFGGTLGTVIVTDMLKIFAAEHIRLWLKPHLIAWVRILAGGILAGFGCFLFAQIL
jgi:threonine/homoserine/homoserine lactone efflux protein